MNKQVLNLWVNALRSGEYEQGQGALFYENTYCCLGVLCDLAIKNGVDVLVEKNEDYTHNFDGQNHYPPKNVLDWAGLDKKDPDVIHDGNVRSVALLNDEYDLSFSDIANLIEKEYRD